MNNIKWLRRIRGSNIPESHFTGSTVLVLPHAVVSMELQMRFTGSMSIKKVMQHAYSSISTFSWITTHINKFICIDNGSQEIPKIPHFLPDLKYISRTRLLGIGWLLNVLGIIKTVVHYAII